MSQRTQHRRRFDLVREGGAGVATRAYQIGVCSCGKQERIHDNTAGGLPPEVVAKKLARAGWKVASVNKWGADLCPRCAAAPKRKEPTVAKPDDDRPKPKLSAAQRRAAFCRIAKVPKAKEPKPTMTQTETTKPAPVTAAPRQPSLVERRRILDALEFSYLIEKGCYKADGSDENVASSLDLPRGWVTTIRQDFFGLGAGNEAATITLRAIDDLEKRLAALTDRFLTEFSTAADAIKADIEKLRRGLPDARKVA